ncbi:hypothetical protein DFJ73DRAFT_601050, partial [Zopfochytrium polystomum]
KFERRLRRTKRMARSEIESDDWRRYQYSGRVNFWLDPERDHIERISCRTCSKVEFIERFEAPGLPVVITEALDDWPAATNWHPEKLLLRFHSEKFKIGEDDDGEIVYMQFADFMRYSLLSSCPNPDPAKPVGLATADDSPLYIFDGNFGDRSRSSTANDIEAARQKRKERQMLKDYNIPKYFIDDLFQYTGSRRPPHRWVVIGSARSGTGIHIDPLGTSAWNALLFGHKRWALFPPHIPKWQVTLPNLPDSEASTWFGLVYPALNAESTRCPATGMLLAERLGMVEILQRPGEVVFVPGGWHHVVINLDFTVAVTQNFCSTTNFESVFLRTRSSRPRLAQKL